MNGTIAFKNQIIQYLLNEDINKKFELKVYKEKRTLKANAYYWSLLGQLADALRIKKDDLHFKLLKDYGQAEVISIKADINIMGYFKYYEELGKSILNGIEFIHFKIYKPSHEMNSTEFSILLEGLVQECKQQISLLTSKPFPQSWGMALSWKDKTINMYPTRPL